MIFPCISDWPQIWDRSALLIPEHENCRCLSLLCSPHSSLNTWKEILTQLSSFSRISLCWSAIIRPTHASSLHTSLLRRWPGLNAVPRSTGDFCSDTTRWLCGDCPPFAVIQRKSVLALMLLLPWLSEPFLRKMSNGFRAEGGQKRHKLWQPSIAESAKEEERVEHVCPQMVPKEKGLGHLNSQQVGGWVRRTDRNLRLIWAMSSRSVENTQQNLFSSPPWPNEASGKPGSPLC